MSEGIEYVPVVVVGGGQAGLSVSRHLTDDGIDHVVLERSTAMHEWSDARWDSFCLVTPNWQCRLPGYSYDGDDPDGFMVRDQIVDWLAGFRASFDPPVRENTAVLSVRRLGDPADGGWSGGFEVQTSNGTIRADQVVVATGGYHRPRVPRLAERLPDHVVQLHSSSYRSPADLPDGPVLVVGTGQSGAQIAEDLHLTGRQVHLAVGNAPRFARTYRGRDVIAWLEDMGHYDKPVTTQPLSERGRDRTNHYVTGRDGGRDIDLRLFAGQGMQLYGHLLDVDGGRFRFADDLAAALDSADATYNGINAAVDLYIDAQGIDAPPASVYEPVWAPSGPATALDVAGIAGVVWATGFTSDYSWLKVSVFDGAGHPEHVRGVTDVPGLYFVGLPWLHSWGSGRFAGVARDAAHLAEHLRSRHTDTPAGRRLSDHLHSTAVQTQPA